MSLYMYPDRFIYFFFLGDIYIYNYIQYPRNQENLK